MPTGQVSWFDAKAGVGRIIASGREYPVRAADMEIGARATGARVHFDVKRQDGSDRAVNVRNITGTRSGPRQGRFADMVGTSRAEDKGRRALTRQRADRDITPGKPGAVVAHWIRAANSGSVVATRDLYAPDVALHAGADTRHGRGAVPGWLLDHNMLAPTWALRRRAAREGDAFVVVRGPDRAALARSRIRIQHGQIAEQWIDEP